MRQGQFSTPPVAMIETLYNAILGAFNAVVPHPEIAHSFVAPSARAGLPKPSLFAEIILDGGANSIFYPYIVSSSVNLRPVMEKHGLVPPALLRRSYKDVEEEIRTDLVRLSSQLR